jgi:putative flavoprotein involved in K+ transport
MDASGLLDERYDQVPDLVRARHLPSMQLVGSPGRTVDLNALRREGVRLVGRLAGIRDGVAQFSGSLPNVCALADLKLGRLLDMIDAWAAQAGLGGGGYRCAPTEVPAAPLSVDLRSGEISTIVDLRGVGQGIPDAEQRLDVHAVVDRDLGCGHGGGPSTLYWLQRL